METAVIGFAVDEGVLFSNHKGKHTDRIETRQRKLARQIAFIRPFLRDEERVLLITTGCSPFSFLERYLTSLTIYYFKRSLFVFTNQRIFHVPTKLNYSYRNSIAQIELGDCSRILMKGSTLVVDYNSEKVEKFFNIGRRERKKIKSLVDTLSVSSHQDSTTERSFLCPRCTSILEKGNATCRSCRLEFKSRAAGRKISILVPGGGYFYTQQPTMGSVEAVFEIFLLLGVVVSLAGYVDGEQGAIGAAMVYGILLVYVKLIAIHYCGRFLDEFLPIDAEIRVRPKSK